MYNPFPQESIDLVNARTEKLKQNNPGSTLSLFRDFMLHLGENSYSFSDNLRTGKYATYPHEMLDDDSFGYNCTNIIPLVFTYAQAFGYDPQIVRFANWRNTRASDVHESKKDPAEHYSLVFEHKGKHYLVDPFFETFGTFTIEDEGRMVVQKNGKSKRLVREYDHMNYISVDDFKVMMDRMQEPGPSLDMLVAGQKVFSGRVTAGILGSLKVSYDDESNEVHACLYLPQQLTTDKAVIARHAYDDEGERVSTTFDLLYADDDQWNTLVNPRKIAEISSPMLRILQSELRPVIDVMKGERLGPKLLDSPRPTLYDVVDEIVTPELFAQNRARILARTLYECTQTESDFLFSEEQHMEYVRTLNEELNALRRDKELVGDELWRVGWKWDFEGKEHKGARSALRRKQNSIDAKIVKNKYGTQINFFNYLRSVSRPRFRRFMDHVEFAKTLKGVTLDDLEERVEGAGLDTRIGYLAMVSDFIPMIRTSPKSLNLVHFSEPFKEKIKARRAMIAEMLLAAE